MRGYGGSVHTVIRPDAKRGLTDAVACARRDELATHVHVLHAILVLLAAAERRPQEARFHAAHLAR